jgi:voltage-gated potassium channel
MPNKVEPVSFWDAQRGSRENFDLLLNDPTSSQLARAWSLLIMMTIAVSVITFITQTIQSLAAWPGWDIMERVCVAIFSLEYVGRLAVARHRLRWMLQYLNLVDLAAILPAYATFITQADSPVGFIRVIRMVSTLSTLQYLRSAR